MRISSWKEFNTYAAVIQELDKNCFGGSSWNLNTWENLFKNRFIFVNLEFHQRSLAGFIVISSPTNEGEVLRIGVEKKFRNRNIGKTLLGLAIQELQESKTDSLFLEVRADNKQAIRLYQRYGFKLTGERKRYYSDPPCDALLFSLDIV